jgi:hypothetical protein
MRRTLALATILGAAWAASATADGGGPSPGPSWGGAGVVNGSGTIRYVALDAGPSTVVEAVSTRGGNVLRWTRLRGPVGLPMVAWDGSMGGLARSGERLVLASPQWSHSTRFVLLDAATLRVRARVRLRGSLIQYLGSPFASDQSYAVRALDWRTRKLLPGSIVDRREPDEKMTGQPQTRTGTPGGWAYTLYSRTTKRPFVHALDTVHRRAFCVDLPWKDQSWIGRVRMRVRGRTLELRRDGRTIARIDRRTLEVSP